LDEIFNNDHWLAQIGQSTNNAFLPGMTYEAAAIQDTSRF
jgi:hypothetical protein